MTDYTKMAGEIRQAAKDYEYARKRGNSAGGATRLCKERLSNVMVNYADDIVAALAAAATAEKDKAVLTARIESLTAALAAADEEYNELKRSLNASTTGRGKAKTNGKAEGHSV